MSLLFKQYLEETWPFNQPECVLLDFFPGLSLVLDINTTSIFTATWE